VTFIKAWESDLSTPEETLPTVCTPTFTSSPKLLHFTLSGATVLAGRQEILLGDPPIGPGLRIRQGPTSRVLRARKRGRRCVWRDLNSDPEPAPKLVRHPYGIWARLNRVGVRLGIC
jgi:hypothetical protein